MTEVITPESLYGDSADEWVRRWDAGDSIWSVEMGGLGPGYEQALQIAAVEIVRVNLKKPLPHTGEALKEWGYDFPKDLGLTGAQAGAARNLAYKMLKCGPAKVMQQLKDQGKEDRQIQISREWPKPPEVKP